MADTGEKRSGTGQHAEGSHGDKTHASIIEQLESGLHGEPATVGHAHEPDGTHRLFERREQHDVADVNSEKNRLDKDIEAHGHNRENFQVRGGAGSVRDEPRHSINPEHPDAPTPGESGAMPQRVPGEGSS